MLVQQPTSIFDDLTGAAEPLFLERWRYQLEANRQASRRPAARRADRGEPGGGEELHWSLTLLFDAMGALSSKYNATPETASRAYDETRDGFVIAGGGGMLVLEELEHAKARGAKIYAELTGYGATSDGYDMVAPSGEGAVRCMQQALATAVNATADTVEELEALWSPTFWADIQGRIPGWDEAIDRFCRGFLGAGRNVVVLTPAFEMVERYVRLAGAGVIVLREIGPDRHVVLVAADAGAGVLDLVGGHDLERISFADIACQDLHEDVEAIDVDDRRENLIVGIGQHETI